MTRRERVIASALWAAWGDALGFMTELAPNEQVVKSRTGSSVVKTTTEWRRQFGTHPGVRVHLPAGCYSDDTQLRLATSRAIRSDGRFDVEAFAAVELPVFLNYSLGAGRGTKAAALNLVKSRSSWCTNFFQSGGSKYTDGGGNGAAMRIQPHVWAASNPADPHTWIPDVVRNVITTHGHVRALSGALFHAAMLGKALDQGALPDPRKWTDLKETLELAYDFVLNDSELSTLWLPAWEREGGSTFRAAIDSAKAFVANLLHVLKDNRLRSDRDWQECVQGLGGLSSKTRGAGDITAVLAGALAWASREDPERGIVVAANTLGSDTDTIATMAGALMGATHGITRPPGPLQDEAFIGREANRLVDLASGRKRSFRYPDLLTWSAPRAAIDMVGLIGDRVALIGLGFLDLEEEYVLEDGRTPTIWRWGELTFHQHVLVRHRPELRRLDERLLPGAPLPPLVQPTPDERAQVSLFDIGDPPLPTGEASAAPISQPSGRVAVSSATGERAAHDLGGIVHDLEAAGFPADRVGSELIRLSSESSDDNVVHTFVRLLHARLRSGR